MATKVIAGVIAVLMGVCGLAAMGVAAVFGSNGNSPCIALPATSGSVSAAIGGYDPEQVTNAATIISVGQHLNVPPRGWVIAIAVALQESALRNVTTGNNDGVGLFHQRPSQDWGTPAQLRDPTYAATTFLQKLLTVPDWQSIPL